MKSKDLDLKVADYLKGDQKAFDYIYDVTHKIVYFNILYIVKSKATAEDLLHDTYIRAIQNLASYQQGTNFTAWVVRIGKNLALNHVQRYKRETLTDFSEQSYRFGTTETELPYIFDVARKVLSEEEYQIVMMCQVAGYKRREVAAMLDMPIATITWKNNQALKKLQKHLQEVGQ